MLQRLWCDWIWMFLILCACRSPTPKTPADAPKKSLQDPVRLSPFVIRAMPDPRDSARIAIDAYDAGDLFGRASAAYREEVYPLAIKLFRQVVEEFPGTEFASPALYNAGLASERLSDFQKATTFYETLVDKYPESEDITDALFRLTGAYEALEMWEDAARTLDKLMTKRRDLEAIERVECLARKGAALIHLNRPHEARENLKKAVMFYRAGSDISPTAPTYFYAMAKFKIGEIIENEMRAIVLPADEAAIGKALEKKCQLLLDAQTAYTDAIRVAHSHWAAAAAYRIGHLYRILWGDMMTAPPPSDLNEKEQDIYREILRKQIRVLLKKAVRQWERVLSMADRLALSNEWVERTKADLADIREILALNPDDEQTTESDTPEK
jgi:tetratricopeptide (TPR) repeat protein